MFRRTYLGLDICPEGLRAIAVQRAGRHIALAGGQLLDFSDEVIHPSTTSLPVQKPDAFVDAVREVLQPLARSEERIALSLPNATGYTFLLNVETPLKSRQQSIDILKWQIKEKLPDGFKDFKLDYQVLSELESGNNRVLVSVIDNGVLHQFEDLIEEAGYSANLIDFHSFQLYNCYRSKTDLGDDFMLVAVSEKELILLGFQAKVLDFFRAKTVGVDPEQVFRELNRSLVAYRGEHPANIRSKIYLHSDWRDTESLQEAVRAAFASDIHLLPGPLNQLKGQQGKLAVAAGEAARMAAALGSAERLIDKVI